MKKLSFIKFSLALCGALLLSIMLSCMDDILTSAVNTNNQNAISIRKASNELFGDNVEVKTVEDRHL